jgi:hypothetical protein
MCSGQLLGTNMLITRALCCYQPVDIWSSAAAKGQLLAASAALWTKAHTAAAGGQPKTCGIGAGMTHVPAQCSMKAIAAILLQPALTQL